MDEQLMSIWFALSCGMLPVYFVSVLLLTWYYHHLRFTQHSRSIWKTFAAMMLMGLVNGFCAVYGSMAGFGGGTWMMIGSFPVTLVAIVYHIALSFGLRRKFKNKMKSGYALYRLRTKIVAFIAVVTYSLSPLIGFVTISTACYRLHTASAQPIIDALEDYHGDHNQYPAELDALVPNYISRIPYPACHIPYLMFSPGYNYSRWDETYRIEVRSVHLFGLNRYYQATGEWRAEGAGF